MVFFIARYSKSSGFFWLARTSRYKFVYQTGHICLYSEQQKHLRTDSLKETLLCCIAKQIFLCSTFKTVTLRHTLLHKSQGSSKKGNFPGVDHQLNTNLKHLTKRILTSWAPSQLHKILNQSSLMISRNDKILLTFDLWKFSDFLSGPVEIRRTKKQFFQPCHLLVLFEYFLYQVGIFLLQNNSFTAIFLYFVGSFHSVSRTQMDCSVSILWKYIC